MTEKRGGDRLRWSANVIVRDQSGRTIATESKLRDLSPRGLSISTDESLTRGLTYRFELKFPHHPINLTGRVAHLKNEWNYFTAGIEITGVSLATRSRINRILSGGSPEIRRRQAVLSVSVAGGIAIVVGFLFGASLSVDLAIFGAVSALLYGIKPF